MKGMDNIIVTHWHGYWPIFSSIEKKCDEYRTRLYVNKKNRRWIDINLLKRASSKTFCLRVIQINVNTITWNQPFFFVSPPFQVSRYEERQYSRNAPRIIFDLGSRFEGYFSSETSTRSSFLAYRSIPNCFCSSSSSSSPSPLPVFPLLTLETALTSVGANTPLFIRRLSLTLD